VRGQDGGQSGRDPGHIADGVDPAQAQPRHGQSADDQGDNVGVGPPAAALDQDQGNDATEPDRRGRSMPARDMRADVGRLDHLPAAALAGVADKLVVLTKHDQDGHRGDQAGLDLGGYEAHQ
jgi:hypothetical protein